jgi:hypothetical protein
MVSWEEATEFSMGCVVGASVGPRPSDPASDMVIGDLHKMNVQNAIATKGIRPSRRFRKWVLIEHQFSMKYIRPYTRDTVSRPSLFITEQRRSAFIVYLLASCNPEFECRPVIPETQRYAFFDIMSRFITPAGSSNHMESGPECSALMQNLLWNTGNAA